MSSSHAPVRVTLAQLEDRYNVPLIDVASELGMSMTMLKQTCRALGIKRWPHRLIRSIDRSIAQARARLDAALASGPATAAETAKLRAKVHELKEKRQCAIAETSRALPTSSARRAAAKLHAPRISHPPQQSRLPTRALSRRASSRRLRSYRQMVEGADSDAESASAPTATRPPAASLRRGGSRAGTRAAAAAAAAASTASSSDGSMSSGDESSTHSSADYTSSASLGSDGVSAAGADAGNSGGEGLPPHDDGDCDMTSSSSSGASDDEDDDACDADAARASAAAAATRVLHANFSSGGGGDGCDAGYMSDMGPGLLRLLEADAAAACGDDPFDAWAARVHAVPALPADAPHHLWDGQPLLGGVPAAAFALGAPVAAPAPPPDAHLFDPLSLFGVCV